jgi:hypothetical protein
LNEAKLPLDERSHHQCHDVDVEKGDNSVTILEVYGGNLLIGFEL